MGCIGIAAALQGQTAVKTTSQDNRNGFTCTAPENYTPPGTIIKNYATKKEADDAAALAPAGSLVVKFQKQGAPGPDGTVIETAPGTGPFDYYTKVNIDGTDYYANANQLDFPAGTMKVHLRTTAPDDLTVDSLGTYTASKWYVTIISPKKR